MKGAASTVLKNLKKEMTDSALDIISSRPKEPEVSRKVLLLMATG